MCGISGVISNDNSAKRDILNLNSLIRHRGPDDEGYTLISSETGKFVRHSGDDSVNEIKTSYSDISGANFTPYNVILGHRRLSIIDLSSSGHCPMSNPEGTVWITYNGEIYNYIELREELRQKGFTFKTKSDTEVIINAYICWGINCLEKFNGMWAFAIWDSVNKRLFAARDRFGIKPFYYYHNPDKFIFSSEIKPLLASIKDYRLNSDVIPFFILYGNRLNEKETYIRNVNSLKASHYLIFENGKVFTKRYYDVPVKEKNNSLSGELEKELIDLLNDSVSLRFRSDVPVGTCLSGGFDSSSIVSLSDKLNKHSLNTFSAVWEEKECDESVYIDLVNSQFNCIPNKVIPNAGEFEKVFSEINYFQEIPSEGPGLYPQWYVMKEAKNKVKVLLDGQGGDEVFGGYFLMGTYLRSLVKDKNFRKILSGFGNYRDFFRRHGTHTFFSWIFPDLYSRIAKAGFSKRLSIINKDRFPDKKKSGLDLDINPPKKFSDYFSNLSYHYLYNVTIPALLHYEDRSSMAHSIESRVPFLDYRLVEFGINLKPEYLSENGVSRPLFRRALKPYLPEEISNRKDKLGFPTPFTKWSRTNLKNYINDTLLSDSLISEYTDKNQLKQNLDNHYSGKIDYGWEIWRLLSLEYILGMYRSVNKITK